MLKISNLLYAMIFIRILSSLIELSAAFLMYHFKSIDTAIRINAVLGFVGPIILILVTFIGLVGISSTIDFKNLLLIAAGVTLILLGTR
ncbi:MAG: YqhV family protein [Halanaerobiaceae bacterium]